VEVDVQSDEACLRSVAHGDQRAFTVLFERHSDFVYNVAFRRTASWSAAEDITEIVFLELWRQRQRVTTMGGSIRPWLAGVASNQSRRWWRDSERKARAVARLAGVRGGPDGAEGDPAEVVAARVDDQRHMRTLLVQVDELPADQRDVLMLWAWERFSYEEIAAALRVPVGTVRSRLSRARTRLRLGDSGGDGTAGTQGASITGPPNGAAEAMRPDDDRGGNR
jgi:RNA polymerase sigma factor (sigma-70 family)